MGEYIKEGGVGSTFIGLRIRGVWAPRDHVLIPFENDRKVTE